MLQTLCSPYLASYITILTIYGTTVVPNGSRGQVKLKAVIYWSCVDFHMHPEISNFKALKLKSKILQATKNV